MPTDRRGVPTYLVPMPTPTHIDHGLSQQDAAGRLAADGPNRLPQAPPTPWWRHLLAQFQSLIVWLLIGACVLSAVMGEVGDAVAIACILLLNAAVGFRQEYAAEHAVLALRAMTAPKARLRRNGEVHWVDAGDVVVGDVLILEAGDTIAADAILRKSTHLTTIEAALTGESAPVDKSPDAVDPKAPLAERADHVWLGTSVATGTGVGEVVATGPRTQLGGIAHLLAQVEQTRTPLQIRLEEVGRTLVWLCLGIVAVVAALGVWRGHSWMEVLLVSISLAVAAVPEGLPTVVTIALAVGVKRMAARHVLVRRLVAVETLGSATVICTDKTGTLTEGRMVVRDTQGPDLPALLHAAAACCDAEWTAERSAGDPTEVAILQAAAATGITRDVIERDTPRVLELPFDSERRRMAVARSDGRIYVKGAPEAVLPLCAGVDPGTEAQVAAMAKAGLRVLAVASGQGTAESNLSLLGFLGLADPPRPEAIQAVADARAAGIHTVMITGDHPLTAAAIAAEMGIVPLEPADPAVPHVHARATPSEKLDIVRAWKARGHIVAMTGDGVNDAPALREAHIGIAMGKNGTDVAREAADMVLTDDNFASILAAIKEGRGIFANIQKTLVYLLSGNLGELMLMLGAALLALPIPLLPLQLLWVNLVTDGMPALALVMEPVEKDVLLQPPRAANAPVLGRPEWLRIGMTAVLETAVTLGVFLWTLQGHSEAEARSATFLTLVVAETVRSMAARSAKLTTWQLGWLSNPRLLAVVVGSLGLQVAIQNWSWSQSLFGLVPLDAGLMGVAALLGVIPWLALEMTKLIAGGRRPRAN